MSLIFLFVIFISKLFHLQAEIIAVMEPRDPYLEEGGTIVLNCTLIKAEDGIDSRSIYVRSRGVNYTYPWVVPIDKMTAHFKLDKVNVSNTGAFVCMIPGKILGPNARQFVHIFRKPEKPKLMNCTLRQMKILECLWLPSVRDQHFRTNVYKPLRHVLQIFKERGENITHDCSNSPHSSCSVSLVKEQGDIMPLLNKKICARVVLNVTHLTFIAEYSDVKCWNLSEIIYPEAPEFLRMEETNEGCLLEWDQPFRERYKSIPLIFYLTLVPSYNKSKRFFIEVGESSYTFTSCQPYTKYSVLISSMSSFGGFHSEITDFSFETHATTPCQGVETSQYLVFTDLLQGKMLVYWKPLSEKEYCGPGFVYVLVKRLVPSIESDFSDTVLTGPNDTKWISLENVPASSSSVQFEIKNSCFENDCIFSIVPKNDIGYQLNNMTTFQWNVLNDSITVESLVVEISGSFAFLSWNTVNKKIMSQRTDSSVVIYTCHNLSHSICRHDLKWQVAKPNLEHYNFSVEHHNPWDLNYGIAIFVAGVSSEIFWSQRTFNLYGKILQPSQVVVKSTNIANSLHVYWSFDQNDCQNCSYVVCFGILYCQTFDHKACNGNITEVKVPNYLRMFEIPDLEPGASYLIWMASFSGMAMSSYTDKFVTNNQKPETRYVVLVCVVIGVLIFILLFCIFRHRDFCGKWWEKICGFTITTPDTPDYSNYYCPKDCSSPLQDPSSDHIPPYHQEQEHSPLEQDWSSTGSQSDHGSKDNIESYSKVRKEHPQKDEFTGECTNGEYVPWPPEMHPNKTQM